MTTNEATNEACIGWLDVNLLKSIFPLGKISKFLAVGWDSPPSPGFLIKV